MREHFSEFFRLTEPETKDLWAEAVFVFDTNVLLNLYRMSQETSRQIRNILNKLQGRIFLPHQVGVEFFRHREEEIAKQVNAFERVRDYLKQIPEKFTQEFSRHPCIPITAITGSLQQCADEQVNIVTASQQQNQLNFLIHDDPILPELDVLFMGSSEGPYTDADNDALNRKVEERVQKNLAPCLVSTGGKASAPAATNPHWGDGRIWFQIIKHAGITKKPVVFVTGDVKSNWWRTVRLGNEHRPIGPHFELIRDIGSASQNKFAMYTQEQFLSEAPKYLGVPEQSQAISEVRQIRESAGADDAADLLDEPKSSPLEDLRSLDEKAERTALPSATEKDAGSLGSLEEPKATALEHVAPQETAEGKEEVN